MPWTHDTPDGPRRTRAVQILYRGEPVGYVTPDDLAAWYAGAIDDDGLIHIARHMPDPPPGTVRDGITTIRWVD